MNKKFTKLMSWLLIFAMIMMNVPVAKLAFAADSGNVVRVVIMNNTFSKEAGAAWDGKLLDTTVELTSESNGITVIDEAVKSAGYTITGVEYNYITEIGGLAAYDNGYMSGWMATLNDWFTSATIESYSVANGSLQPGDEICMWYSCDWGADIGSDWMGTSTLLKDITFSEGTLSSDFNPETKEYTLTISDDVEEIMVTPTAENKNFMVKTYKNDYTPKEEGTEFKRSESIPVKSGDKIFVGVGNENWPSMNSGQTETVYVFTVEGSAEVIEPAKIETAETTGKINPAFNKDILTYEIEVENVDDLPMLTFTATKAVKVVAGTTELSADENGYYQMKFDKLEQQISIEDESGVVTTYTFKVVVKSVENNINEVKDIFNETTDAILKGETPIVGSIGGEWRVIGLARAGKISKEFKEGYYKNAYKYVKEIGSAKLHNSKSSDNSKMILALTALGYDVTNVAGQNLLAPLSNLDYVKKQGINGLIWALIALDSGKYDVPELSGEGTRTTRDNLIKSIINSQLENGGFALDNENSETDMTAMALQALAPYYLSEKTNKEYKDSLNNTVDKAIAFLANTQNDDGSFGNIGGNTCESTAQVVVALSSLGINPDTDDRFVKNNTSVLAALLSYYNGNGKFIHEKNGNINEMSTEQAYLAMVAYNRFIEGKETIYDMSDVVKGENPVITENISSENKAPQTGDNGYALYVVLLTVSAMGVYASKKRRTNKA